VQYREFSLYRFQRY